MRRVQVCSPGCPDFSVGADLVSRTLLHSIYGIATSLAITDQEGDELDDSCEMVANDARVTELNVFDEEYLELVDHEHDGACADSVHAHGHSSHCARQCVYGEVLRARKHYCAQKWLQFALEQHRPRHAWLYARPVDVRRWLTADVADALLSRDATRMRSLVRTEAERTKLFSLQLFSDEACAALIDEVTAFEDSGLPASRPNSMNRYGLVLDHIGLRPVLDELRAAIMPLMRELFAGERGIDSIDDHHAFVVQYAASGAAIAGDVDLGFHYDESEFTVNVCLGRQFTGSRLFFRGLLEKPETQDEDLLVTHQQGRALLHIGKHRHGAEPIESGSRFNLIFWFRSRHERGECGGHAHAHAHVHAHDEPER